MLTSKINGFSATVVRVQGQDIDICMLTNNVFVRLFYLI